MDEPTGPKCLVAREVAPSIATALADTRIVLVTGPRQAGKTTIVRQFAEGKRRYVSLDDPSLLAAARSDPTGFIRGLPDAVIDEIQRAPELMLVLKMTVDDDTRPGRYLLTGSANVMALPTVGDSLAGRIELVRLLPFAQCELNGSNSSFIDRLFNGEDVLSGPFDGPAVIDEALVARVLAGGFPEALARKPHRRAQWYEDYLALILDRDVRDTASLEQLDAMPRLVELLAQQAGQLSNIANIANAVKLSRPTVGRYIEVLERLFLVRQVAPWYSNRISRLIKTPKIHFLDSGLLAARLDLDAAAARAAPERWGPVLETFVFAELSKLLSWSETRVTISHFRTKDQDEVDFVLEDRRGRIVGIEVKSGATLRRGDSSGLRKLQEAAGDKFVRGLILHNHDRVTPIAEKIHGAPISLLWNAL